MKSLEKMHVSPPDKLLGRIMKPVKISNLIEALESASDEYGSWVDLEEGRVVCVEHSLIRALEEGDGNGGHVEEWEWAAEEVEIAREMVADADRRFVEAPNKFDFHEYRQMERFIGTVEDSDAAEQLWQAIKGRGAFRYFKDTASRLGLLQQWFQYREDAMKTFVRDWAGAHGIPIIDD
jgi:hypothetical protein